MEYAKGGIFLSVKSVTERVAELIREQGKSSAMISAKLDIPKSRLEPGTQETLDADEFLRLCAYLKTDPKYFR